MFFLAIVFLMDLWSGGIKLQVSLKAMPNVDLKTLSKLGGTPLLKLGGLTASFSEVPFRRGGSRRSCLGGLPSPRHSESSNAFRHAPFKRDGTGLHGPRHDRKLDAKH